MKRFIGISFLTIFMVTVGLCNSPNNAWCDEKKILMRMGQMNPHNDDYVMSIGIQFLGKRIEELNDRIKVEVHEGTLGPERQITEGVQLGTIQAGIVTPATLGGFIKEMGILNLPLVFNSWEHAFSVLDGPFGNMLEEKALKKGFRIIGWWGMGAKCAFTNVPIKEMSEFAGVKIRCMESPEPLALYKAYGAVPVPMAFPEVYGALQQGVVDGVDCEYAGCWMAKIQEVTKYVTELNHIYIFIVPTVSEKWFKNQPEDVKMAILQAGIESQKVCRDFMNDSNMRARKRWEEYGVKIFKPEDIEKFRAVGKKIWPEFYERAGKENIDWVVNVGERYKK